MDNIKKALGMIMAQLKAEEGDDFQFEDGDGVVAVFNDGVIFVVLEGTDLKVNIVAGEPLKFDFDLDLLEKKTIEE